MYNPSLKEASWQWPTHTQSQYKTIVKTNQKKLDTMSKTEYEQMSKQLEGFFHARSNHHIATSNDPDNLCDAKAMRDVLAQWKTIKQSGELT